MDERTNRIERALILARTEYTTIKSEYGRYCPYYWRRVFKLYFGDLPTRDEDPRWNELLKIGFPEQHRLLEKEKKG